MQLCVNGTVLDALWISLLEKSSLAYTTTLWWLSTANPFPHVCSVQHMVFFNFLLENKRLSHALHLCCYSLTAWFSTSCFINLLLKKKTILAFWACCCTWCFFFTQKQLLLACTATLCFITFLVKKLVITFTATLCSWCSTWCLMNLFLGKIVSHMYYNFVITYDCNSCILHMLQYLVFVEFFSKE